MTAQQIIDELKPLAKDSYRSVLLKHGIAEPVLGVSVEQLQKIRRRIKKDYQLALDLYDTGIYDAMYLAGLIADDEKMTKKDLHRWASQAGDGPLWGSTVAWVAAGSNHGRGLALEWIDSKKPGVAVAGWGTFSSLVAIRDDSLLNLPELARLLQRVRKTIHDEPDEVRYAMNRFVIALGTHVAALTDSALAAAEKIGPVAVNMGQTACKVPSAPDYIRKAQKAGKIGKKRATAKC